MRMRFAPVASAVTAIMLVSACGDDDSSTTTSESSATTTEAPDPGATTLAKGKDIALAGGQTLNIDAEAESGEVTGEIRLADPAGDVVVTVECADTLTNAGRTESAFIDGVGDGIVILGGTVTEADDDTSGLVALFIREGDPDSVAVWYDEGENPSCSDLLRNRHDVLDDPSAFVDVEAGSNIETG